MLSLCRIRIGKQPNLTYVLSTHFIFYDKYNLNLFNTFILYFIVGYLERQKLLEDQWYFKCGCTRCKDPSDCGTWSNSISCFQCANPRWSLFFLDSWIDRAITWLNLLEPDYFPKKAFCFENCSDCKKNCFKVIGALDPWL